MSAGPAPKKPINRKLVYVMLAGLGVVTIAALVLATVSDPRAERQAEDAAREAEQLRQLPTGTEQAGAEKIRLAEEEARRKAARDQADAGAIAALDGAAAPGAGTAGGLPAYDPALLAELDAAQREIGARQPAPVMGSGFPTDLPQGETAGPRAGGGSGDGIGKVYENYGSRSAGGESGGGGDLFGGGGDADTAGAGVYETVKPQTAPSTRVVNQGALIPAVLLSRIDTRNQGPVVAMVTRTVYDSRTQTIPLIPQGSRLVGSYETTVEPGVDRIPGTFERLILPNGQSFVLPSVPTSGLDGTIGVRGRYRSNILRAIGPSFVVAAIGQWIDREYPAPSSAGATPGGTVQSPSVVQQVVPKINEAVMDRYEGAKPYFTVKPGQEVRLVLTADLEVPVVNP